MKRLGLALILTYLVTLRAFAWSTEGHRAIAIIAQQELKENKQAADKLATLLQGLSLDQIATCPDEIRDFERSGKPMSAACKKVFPVPPKGTASWHFVNTPITTAGTAADVQKACGEACVVSKIAAFEKILANPASTTAARRQAVSWLVHLIGDVHQPLHAIVRNNDSGGNAEHVGFNGENVTLHHLWDDSLVRVITSDAASLAGKLGPEITAIENAEKLHPTTTTGWAIASFNLAKTTVYPDIPDGNGDQIVATIKTAYVTRATPVVRSQLAAAGVHLAKRLAATIH